MSRCYHPHAFDSDAFEARTSEANGSAELSEALMEAKLDEPDFGWSLDGTPDNDLIATRVGPGGHVLGSVVDAVRAGARAAKTVPCEKAARLLAHASNDDGRLIDEEPFVGYLLRREIEEIDRLLRDVRFGPRWAESDRVLLLTLFEVARRHRAGLFWMAF